MSKHRKPTIGLVLGSGSARGLAHIGVIEELEKNGIHPDIICGTSAGALVGAIHITGNLADYTHWMQSLSTADILHYMNLRLSAPGGVAEMTRLMDHFRRCYGDGTIESQKTRFACVATNLNSGQEIWLQEGNLWDAVRASISIPGLITPVRIDGQQMVDGGLVNPVPVSLCKAMGADIIIAVNLNGDLIGRHLPSNSERQNPADAKEKDNADRTETAKNKTQQIAHKNKQAALAESPALNTDSSSEDSASSQMLSDLNGNIENLLDRISHSLRRDRLSVINEWFRSGEDETPSLANVLASSINIMQDRITRSRLAGEPADILLAPRLGHIGLMEFHRIDEAIEEGRRCVQGQLSELHYLLGKHD
jgi:NTE family protein